MSFDINHEASHYLDTVTRQSTSHHDGAAIEPSPLADQQGAVHVAKVVGQLFFWATLGFVVLALINTANGR